MGKDSLSRFKILTFKRVNVSKVGKEKAYTASVVIRCLSVPLNL